MDLVGGHPYLVRLALYEIAQNQIPLAEVLEHASTSGGIDEEHLHFQQHL